MKVAPVRIIVADSLRLVCLVFVFLFMINEHCFAEKFQLKGEIVDQTTGEPLPFATIEVFSIHIGTVANDLGIFELKVNPDNSNLDSLTFSHLGYETKSISIHDFLQQVNKTIALETSDILLDELQVFPKKFRTVTVGVTAKKPQSKQVTNLYNNKICNFIENRNGKVGFLSSVSYFLHEEGHPETPFRIRIFNVNKNSKGPGSDLLSENIIVSANAPGWFSIDLSDYNLVFPSEGLFIAMEWINSGDQYFYEMEMKVRNEAGDEVVQKRKFYGQAIGSVLKQPKMLTWGITLGNNWVPYKLFYKGYINAMIKAEITYSLD